MDPQIFGSFVLEEFQMLMKRVISREDEIVITEHAKRRAQQIVRGRISKASKKWMCVPAGRDRGTQRYNGAQIWVIEPPPDAL